MKGGTFSIAPGEYKMVDVPGAALKENYSPATYERTLCRTVPVVGVFGPGREGNIICAGYSDWRRQIGCKYASRHSDGPR